MPERWQVEAVKDTARHSRAECLIGLSEAVDEIVSPDSA